MWSYWKQRQPWQLHKRLQTTLPAASLRHLSGCRPGTVSALAQHIFLALWSKNLGRPSPLLLLLPSRERCGEELISFWVLPIGERERERERGDYQSANARWWWCTNWVTTGERIFLSLIAAWAFEETHVLILTAHWALAEIGKIEWIRIPLEV